MKEQLKKKTEGHKYAQKLIRYWREAWKKSEVIEGIKPNKPIDNNWMIGFLMGCFSRAETPNIIILDNNNADEEAIYILPTNARRMIKTYGELTGEEASKVDQYYFDKMKKREKTK